MLASRFGSLQLFYLTRRKLVFDISVHQSAARERDLVQLSRLVPFNFTSDLTARVSWKHHSAATQNRQHSFQTPIHDRIGIHKTNKARPNMNGAHTSHTPASIPLLAKCPRGWRRSSPKPLDSTLETISPVLRSNSLSGTDTEGDT